MKKGITTTSLDFNLSLIFAFLSEILYQITRARIYRYFAILNISILIIGLILAIVWYFIHRRK